MKSRNELLNSYTVYIENIVTKITSDDNMINSVGIRIINRLKKLRHTWRKKINEISKILDRKVDAFWEERSG